MSNDDFDPDDIDFNIPFLGAVSPSKMLLGKYGWEEGDVEVDSEGDENEDEDEEAKVLTSDDDDVPFSGRRIKADPKHPHDPHNGQFTTTGGHGAGGGATVEADEPASPELSLGQQRQRTADAFEEHVAGIMGGRKYKDYEEFDVEAPKTGGGLHLIEAKTMQYGSKTGLPMKEDAWVRKADFARQHPENAYHTVLKDMRDTAERGIHAEKFSGHSLYYKRASGPYPIKSMHKCKDEAELKRLIAMPDADLPQAARGKFPKGAELKVLREKAEKVREYNNARSAARKKRLGPAAYHRVATGAARAAHSVTDADSSE